MDILICGYGNIGQKTFDEIKPLINMGHDIYIYDIKDETSYVNLRRKYDYCFVCVSTEMLSDGSCDTQNVYDCIQKISADIFIIKSTIPPGTTNVIQFAYRQTEKHFVFSPEFYGTTIHAPSNLNFLILGGEQKYCSKVADLFHLFKPASFRIHFTNSKTAELVKYMENCFLGLKVQFCSEFYDIAQAIGVDYNDLRECFILDERLGESHTYINPEQPYYDSHCLNKDIPGLITFCNGLVDTPIMNAVNEANLNKKKSFGT